MAGPPGISVWVPMMKLEEGPGVYTSVPMVRGGGAAMMGGFGGAGVS
jgi:hypothetical protein